MTQPLKSYFYMYSSICVSKIDEIERNLIFVSLSTHIVVISEVMQSMLYLKQVEVSQQTVDS